MSRRGRTRIALGWYSEQSSGRGVMPDKGLDVVDGDMIDFV